MSYPIIAILFFLPFILCAQSDNDALLTKPIYSDTFEPLPDEPERWLAERLSVLSLHDMVSKNIIHRNDMMGFAMPLGVHNRNTPVDFLQGMIDMWQAKAEWMGKRRERIDADIMLKALNFVGMQKERQAPSSLRDYRNEVISPAIAEVKRIHEANKSQFSDERRQFMDIFVENFSANVMLGYNIQELIPPTHMVGRNILPVNPLFKVYYFDLLLREGGLVYLEGFPARYDALLSHGPFQMTEIAIEGIQANKRLFDDMKRYSSMKDLNSVQDHANVAAFFAYYNWELLSWSLQSSGQIGLFNAHYADYAQDEGKKRNLRILIAGLTACMHHNPALARKMLINTMKEDNPFPSMHYSILKEADKQLFKYYRSAAEAYLMMKVYHLLIK